MFRFPISTPSLVIRCDHVRQRNDIDLDGNNVDVNHSTHVERSFVVDQIVSCYDQNCVSVHSRSNELTTTPTPDLDPIVNLRESLGWSTGIPQPRTR